MQLSSYTVLSCFALTLYCFVLLYRTAGGRYEAALYGALCGHLPSVLPVCASWEDACWAYCRAWLEQARPTTPLCLFPSAALSKHDAMLAHIVARTLCTPRAPVVLVRTYVLACFGSPFHLGAGSCNQGRVAMALCSDLPYDPCFPAACQGHPLDRLTVLTPSHLCPRCWLLVVCWLQAAESALAVEQAAFKARCGPDLVRGGWWLVAVVGDMWWLVGCACVPRQQHRASCAH